jgi:multisubunit Na+/H+ antiporter MnhB subunit
MNQNSGMTLIVKTVTRVTVWIIILYGFYIIFHGHLTPGGGFGGGVIIALAFLNIMLAYGKDETSKWLKIELLQDIEASTATLFLIIGILGIGVGGAFLANFINHGTLFRLISSGTILPLNVIIGIKVGLSLFLVVWFLAKIKIQKGEDL